MRHAGYVTKVERGYCGIGIERSKNPVNLGTLWRSAVALEADFIFTIGRRYHREPSDVVAAYRHVPTFHFFGLEDFRAHIPYACQVVGVELASGARSLERFTHPERAIYLLGPEDGSLSDAAVALCQDVVAFDSRLCLNVASAGTVVLYDRRTKLGTRFQEVRP
jgi:tRNA G18 (ribose-2'-O)-methylase SpoU